jgi:methyl-accepting chemotaxis protein
MDRASPDALGLVTLYQNSSFHPPHQPVYSGFMDHPETAKKLDRIAHLLIANLIFMAIAAAALIVGLLPKLERVAKGTERVARSTERVDHRFQSFADEVEPVVSATADMAKQSIDQIDTDRISKSATDKSDELIDAATDKAKRLLGLDKGKNEPE